MKKTALTVALTAMLGVAATGAQAAVLNAGDVLTITSGVTTYDEYGNPTGVSSGSWFGMDTDANSKIAAAEATAINGLAGITIGVTQGPGVIDGWNFFGPAGTDYTTSPITGGTTNGLDFSGWTVAWGAVPLIPMGSGAWSPLNCGAGHMGCTGLTFTNGVANFAWSGTYGDSYSLWYTATVPDGDASGFGNVQYIVRLVGTVEMGVSEVPVPAAAWLLGSGLLGLVGVARRKAAKA